MDKLTPRQQKFCEFYAASGNASEAARQAGYSEKYINTNTAKLLRNTAIVAYIKKLSERDRKGRIRSIEERQELLTKIASECEDNNARLKAVEILNKMDGVYITKAEVKNEVSGGLNIRWGEDD